MKKLCFMNIGKIDQIQNLLPPPSGEVLLENQESLLVKSKKSNKLKINGKQKIIFIVELNNPERKSWLGTHIANYGTEWYAGSRQYTLMQYSCLCINIGHAGLCVHSSRSVSTGSQEASMQHIPQASMAAWEKGTLKAE